MFLCTKCKEQKEDFPYAKGVRHSWCRDCHREAKKAYRLRLREETPRKKRTAEDIITADGKYICCKCSVAQEPTNFQKGKVGGWCLSCRAEAERAKRAQNGAKPKLRPKVTEDAKECLKCRIILPLFSFSPSERGRLGLSSYCKECVNLKVKDREKQRQATATYRLVNREVYLAQHRLNMFKRRTGKEATSDGSVSEEFLRALYSKETCRYCKTYVEPKDRTADHIESLAVGGKHSASNLDMACRSCNSAKRTLSEQDFMERLNGSKR